MSTIKQNIIDLARLNQNANYMHVTNINNLSQYDLDVINKNIKIINKIADNRKLLKGILVGDYLKMPDGSISRITHCHNNSVQDGGGSGSFHLCSSGYGSYSGSLNHPKDRNKIMDTGKFKKALFWIFSENWVGAHRSFYFYLNVRLWKIEEILKTVYVKFDNPELNYHTSVNGNLSNDEIQKYFLGKSFNMGQFPEEDFHTCKECFVYY